MNITIRNEIKEDYRIVEELTREAFWNLYVPGCSEHFILYNMRNSRDIIPELDFVAELNGKVIGNIVYTRAGIISDAGKTYEVVCFGPISVLPHYQKHGVGKALIEHSLNKAKGFGFTAVCIYGDPRYYHRFGFRCGEKYDIKTVDDKFAVALQVLILSPDVIGGISGRFIESDSFNFDEGKLAEFDAGFPHKEKSETESQREFRYMVSLRY